MCFFFYFDSSGASTAKLSEFKINQTMIIITKNATVWKSLNFQCNSFDLVIFSLSVLMCTNIHTHSAYPYTLWLTNLARAWFYSHSQANYNNFFFGNLFRACSFFEPEHSEFSVSFVCVGVCVLLFYSKTRQSISHNFKNSVSFWLLNVERECFAFTDACMCVMWAFIMGNLPFFWWFSRTFTLVFGSAAVVVFVVKLTQLQFVLLWIYGVYPH